MRDGRDNTGRFRTISMRNQDLDIYKNGKRREDVLARAGRPRRVMEMHLAAKPINAGRSEYKYGFESKGELSQTSLDGAK